MGDKLKVVFLLVVVLKKTRTADPCDGDCSSVCDCFDRNLRSIPRNLPSSVSTLRLQENVITALGRGDFSRYSRLEALYLYNNHIRSIQVGTFTPVPDLIAVYLNSNHLSSLSQGLFHGLNELKSLYLSYNRIKTVPSFAITDLPRLQFLSLGNNGITAISSDAFVNLPSLYYLFLSNNRLTEIPTLEMQLPELANLFLYNNSITEVPANAFSNQPNLINLKLDTNMISYIAPNAFRGLDKLNKLFLYGNRLYKLPDYAFFGLSNLEILRLQDNQLSQLYPNTFKGITKLEYLFLHQNYLGAFPVEAFLKVEIAELWISKNQIYTLPLAAYSILTSIPYKVFIDSNPWHCDCMMAPFRRRMNESYYFFQQITCASPGKFYGKSLVDIDPEDLTCDKVTSVVLGLFFVILIVVGILLAIRYRRKIGKHLTSTSARGSGRVELGMGNLNSTRGAGQQNRFRPQTGAPQRPSKPPSRPPPPGASGKRTAQPTSMRTGVTNSNQTFRGFAKQHHQFSPRSDNGRASLPRRLNSKPPSRPPPPQSAKGAGPKRSKIETSSGQLQDNARQHSQLKLPSKEVPGHIVHVHKPIAGPSTAQQATARVGFGQGTTNKGIVKGDHTQTVQPNQFGSSRKKVFGLAGVGLGLARSTPPSQPPPPPPPGAISKGKGGGKTVSKTSKSGITSDKPSKVVGKLANQFSTQEKGSKQASHPAITRPKPKLLPRPTVEKSVPSKANTNIGGFPSKMATKSVPTSKPPLKPRPLTMKESNLSKPDTGKAVATSNQPPKVVAGHSKEVKPPKAKVAGSAVDTTSQSTGQPSSQGLKVSSRIQAIQSSFQQ